jgi:hypothetical protein
MLSSMLNETAKDILAIAEAADEFREKVKAILKPGDGLNLVLTTISTAERRCVRSYYAENPDGA